MVTEGFLNLRSLQMYWVALRCIGMPMLYVPRRQKGQFPDNTIHWSNADIILGHHLRRWANIILTKPFKL